MKTQWNDKRVHVSVGFMLLAVALFWLGSRYPALNEKALMGTHTEITGLAFDKLIDVLPGVGTAKVIFANTVNWIYTNWKGMTFGVIFGAGLLTLLNVLPRPQFKGYFANALMGMIIGAPLGVCVNCAAPIAQGIHSAGMRRETTLSALIASPSLNVIVVTMSFALLPVYLATIKLVTILIVLLVVIPLFARYLDRVEPILTVKASVGADDPLAVPDRVSQTVGNQIFSGEHSTISQNEMPAALRWFASKYLQNFWIIIKLTVPLMFLAGFLGALLITLVPFGTLIDTLQLPGGRIGTLMTLVLITLFALILPVPIAFDVILVSVLLGAGWSDHFAMSVLLALGTFSVYSYIIIGRAMSFRVATGLGGLLLVVSVAAGLVAFFIHPHFQAHKWAQVTAILEQTGPRVLAARDITAVDRVTTTPIATQPSAARVDHDGDGAVAVVETVLDGSEAEAGAMPFGRVSGVDIGLDLIHANDVAKLLEPMSYFGGIAAGDINGDGWDDIAMGADARDGGLALYINNAGQFMRQRVALAPLEGAYVNAVAFVDLNGDGALDLFAATYAQGAHIFWNQGGVFSDAGAVTLQNADAVMVGAPAFADLDRDGDIDIVAANWVGAGIIAFAATDRSVDRIFWNDEGSFRPATLPGVPGESLSTLIMDVNGDGADDIIIGDDGPDSDKVYINDGLQSFRLLTRSEGMLPYLGHATMSLDAGDINNDLMPDIYLSQITQADTGYSEDFCDPATVAQTGVADRCEAWIADDARILRSSSPRTPNCNLMENAEARSACAIIANFRQQWATDTVTDCAWIPDGWPVYAAMCGNSLQAKRWSAEQIAKDNADHDPLGFLDGRSLLFVGAENGHYTDAAPAQNVTHPGWSWNAKFADFDQDGWQDILVATGFVHVPPYAPNALYHNQAGQGFAYASPAFGLADAIPTASYAMLDYDKDGDLDIIRAPSVHGVIVHRNDAPAGAALWVQLRDQTRDNSHGIGATVTISANGNQQIRHLRASGGFVSFDPVQAHFGLGAEGQADTVTVAWPDGATTKVTGPFAGTTALTVTRTAP